MVIPTETLGLSSNALNWPNENEVCRVLFLLPKFSAKGYQNSSFLADRGRDRNPEPIQAANTEGMRPLHQKSTRTVPAMLRYYLTFPPAHLGLLTAQRA